MCHITEKYMYYTNKRIVMLDTKAIYITYLELTGSPMVQLSSEHFLVPVNEMNKYPVIYFINMLKINGKPNVSQKNISEALIECF